MFRYGIRRARGTAITTATITWDRLERLLSLVSHPYRYRLVSLLLEETTEPIPLDELVEELAEWEAGFDDRTPDPSRIRLQLVHHHLPKLEEAGFVEYDERSETVVITPEPDR